MADTSVFEVIRQTHEEAERHVQSLVDHISSRGGPSSLQKESLRRQLQISAVLDRIVSRNNTLHALYKDVTGDTQREGLALQGSSLDLDGQSYSTAAEAEFYNRLDRIRKYHKKYPNTASDTASYNLDEEVGQSVETMFSGEEMAGRFLDLYVHHEAFLNLKAVRRITYLQYIDSFDVLRGHDSRVTNETKRTDAYKAYVGNLQDYLVRFLRKTRPLSDVDSLEIGALVSFEDDWEKGTLLGWEDHGEAIFDPKKAVKANAVSTTQAGEGIWCDACRRGYAKQTVFDAHLKAPKHLKAVERRAKESTAAGESVGQDVIKNEAIELENRKRLAKARAIARNESVIIAFGAELRTIRAETRSNVERKAALTERERQAEAEAAAAAATLEGGVEQESAGLAVDEEDGGDGEKIYNPLKLPLGWDGKPIPFWLYKLHGLGVEFKCEICSDYVYQGRKNFERHFSESRHAFGMRALGLPNTKHFYEITRIEDALALADKLKKQGKAVAEEQGDAEEVEDEHGNTYTRKTYDLLKRQGLI